MNEKRETEREARAVFEEYREGRQFKESLGARGLYEQNRMNERFFVGDQWYGANCGNDRPLVRHNVIKRIGDYKMAMVGGNPIAVNYSAEGVPNTLELKEPVRAVRENMTRGRWDKSGPIPDAVEINAVMAAMSDYFRVTAERVKFDDLKEAALRNAYQSGTGVLYTYWDDKLDTGLYADLSRRTPIRGDIACEVLDIENVYFGDPNLDDVQGQPYLLIVQRRSVAALRREAAANRRPVQEIERIRPDGDTWTMAGEYGLEEPAGAEKATVITRLWKVWDETTGRPTVKAMRVCENAVIRGEWDTGLRLYPLARFSWERRRNCAYGESEITYLIPNQIAINRMLTASVWAVMMMGMPIMVVNGDVVTGEVTNDPGQIIRTYGDAQEMESCIRYVDPPAFSPQFDQNIASLIENTLTQAGANDAALGDIRPDNTSAIIAVREAATMPLQPVQNRYYSFCEDVARIWAEFWVASYGDRSLKIEDESGTWYLPFEAARYRDLMITAKIDVGASSLWSELQSVRTLDNLFNRGVIDVIQYLSRLPKGTIPNLNGLLREVQSRGATDNGDEQTPAEQKATTDRKRTKGAELKDAEVDEEALLSGMSPRYRQMLDSLPKQVRTTLIRSALRADSVRPETMPSGRALG